MAEKSDFDRLSREWEDGTRHHSNSAIIMGHAACREIVAMGKDAIPWCLKRLKRNRGLHWSMILQEITGQNPAPAPERIGNSGFAAYNVESTAKAWITWGEQNGYL